MQSEKRITKGLTEPQLKNIIAFSLGLLAGYAVLRVAFKRIGVEQKEPRLLVTTILAAM